MTDSDPNQDPEVPVDRHEDDDVVLCFRAGKVWLAIPAHLVEEIGDRSHPIPLPNAPGHVPGIINLRGDALPVFDVRHFLELARADSEEDMRARTVVVNSGDLRVGVLADEVAGLQPVSAEAAGEIHAMWSQPMRQYVVGELDAERGLVAILDADKLLEAARVR